MKKIMTMKSKGIRHKLQVNKKHGRNVHGQGVLEFALALPVMLLLIMGIIEFGRLMLTYSALSSASREAARYGAAVGDDGAGTLAKFEDCDGIREAAKRVTDAFMIVEDANITIQYDRGPGTAFYASCSPDPSAVQLGDRIVVNVSATYTPIMDFGFGEFKLVSEAKRTIVKDVVLQ